MSIENDSFIVRDVTRLPQAVAEHQDALIRNHVLLIEAPMGAGKTTFVSALATLMGSLITPSSPTFSICNEYELFNPISGYVQIVHMDLYRLKSTEEILNSGIDDYIYDPTSLVIVEWPELIIPMIVGEYTYMTIDIGDDHFRKYSYSYRSESG